MAQEPKKRQLGNAAQQFGVEPDDLARMLGLPDGGYTLKTMVQMALVEQLVSASREVTVDMTAQPPVQRPRRSRRRPNPSPEQQLHRQTIEWLEQVQIRAIEFKEMEAAGTPFNPSLEQGEHDGTMVRYADPCADLLGVAGAMKSMPFAKVEEARARGKNVTPWSSLLREKVKDGLQQLIPTVCRCGAPLRVVYQVTDDDVWAVLDARRQLPVGGVRRTGMRRFQVDDLHPECRTMEEARVTLMLELEKMGDDTPEAQALREARYDSFIDEALRKNVDKGATEDTVLRAFRVFVLKEKV